MSNAITPTSMTEAAKQAYQAGNYEKAASNYAAAATAYQAQGNEVMAAEMSNNQSVALLQAGQAQAAFAAVEGTDKVFEKAGETLKMALAIGNQAAALEGMKKLKEAETRYKICAELLKDLGEDEQRARVMQSISSLQLRSGRQLEAIASMQAGMEGMKRPNLRQRILKKLLGLPGKFLNR